MPKSWGRLHYCSSRESAGNSGEVACSLYTMPMELYQRGTIHTASGEVFTARYEVNHGYTFEGSRIRAVKHSESRDEVLISGTIYTGRTPPIKDDGDD